MQVEGMIGDEYVELAYVVGGRIAQGMERQRESRVAEKGTKNTGVNTSWLRDTPHYWAQASLPLAYAVACVEGQISLGDSTRELLILNFPALGPQEAIGLAE
jgi:hypothetical protein